MERSIKYPMSKEEARTLIAKHSVWSYSKAKKVYGSYFSAVVNLRKLFKEELSSPQGKHKSLKKCVRSLEVKMESKDITPALFKMFVDKIKIKKGKKEDILRSLVYINELLEGNNDKEFIHHIAQIIEFGLPFDTIYAQFNEVKNK